MTERQAIKILRRYLSLEESKLFIDCNPQCIELDKEDLDNFVLDWIQDRPAAPQHWNESNKNKQFWNG